MPLAPIENFPSTDILREKNLFAWWKLAAKGKRSINVFNACLGTGVNAIFILYLFPNFLWSKDLAQFTGLIKSIIDLGISLSINMLGFLLAGFTIFSALSDKSMFIEMSKVGTKGIRGVSDLKANIIPFAKILIINLTIISFLGIEKILSNSNGIYWYFVWKLSSGHSHLWANGIFCLFVIFHVNILIFFLFRLKDFAFNLIHVTMSYMGFSRIILENSKKQESQDIRPNP